MRRAVAVALLVAVTTTTAAGTGIGTVVKILEHRYAVHHHGVPGLWLAKPFLIGSGVGGLKVAEFKNFNVPAADMGGLMDELGNSLGAEWQPFVQVWSKKDGEWTTIYAKTAGAKLRLLIVNSERRDGVTLMQVDVNGKAREKWFDEPVQSARKEAGHTHAQERQ
jgi:hypothetical protein